MKKIILCIVVSFSLLTGSKSFAQIYIVFDGVKGESNFAAFPSSTQISSFQWGAENAVTIGSATGGAGAGKVQMSELKITKPRGSASSALQMFVFNGKRIPKAEIRFYKPGSSTQYLTITLEDVFISSWSISGDGGEAPTESLSLNFAKFRTEDAVMAAGGKMEKGAPVGWDISRNMSY